jgi:hypothetical protein
MDDEGCIASFFKAWKHDFTAAFHHVSSKEAFGNFSHNIDPVLLMNFDNPNNSNNHNNPNNPNNPNPNNPNNPNPNNPNNPNITCAR